MRKILLLFLLGTFASAGAQQIDLKKFEPLRSSGTLPEKLNHSILDQYYTWQQKNNTYDSKKERRVTEEFYLASFYTGSKLMMGGRVLFNNPVSKYCEKILEKVSDDKKASVFVFKSNVDETFTLITGEIFVSTGTIARTETEAELAYIIARQLVHLENKHALKNALKEKKFTAGALMSTDEHQILNLVYFTKEQEQVADDKALDMITDAGYSAEGALAYINTRIEKPGSFIEREFDSSFLAKSNILVSPRYFQVEEEEKDSEKDSENSTLEERRESIEEAVSKSSGGEDYIISESNFEKYRDACRFEACRINLSSGNPVKAMYESYALLKERPSNLYLKKLHAKSLYVLSCYANKDKMNDALPFLNKAQGGYKSAVFFMREVTAAEVNVITVNYLWRQHLKHKSDNELKSLAYESLRNLVKYHYSSRKSFAKKLDSSYYSMKAMYQAESSDNEDDEEKEEEEETPKKKKKKKSDDDDDDSEDDEEEAEKDTKKKKNSDKDSKKSNKYKKAKANRKGTKDNLDYAFTSLLKKKEFRMVFDSFSELKKAERSKGGEESEGNSKSALNALKKHGFALGADTVIIAFPHYYSFRERREMRFSYVKSLEGEETLRKYIKECGSKAGCVVQQPQYGNSKDIEALNDLAVLTEWSWERTYASAVGKNLFQDEIDKLIEKYNSSHIVYFSVTSTQFKTASDAEITSMLTSILLWPVLPLTVTMCFLQEHDLKASVSAYNLQSGKMEMEREYVIPGKTRSSTFKSLVYDVFYQMQASDKGVRYRTDAGDESMLTDKDTKKTSNKSEDEEN